MEAADAEATTATPLRDAEESAAPAEGMAEPAGEAPAADRSGYTPIAIEEEEEFSDTPISEETDDETLGDKMLADGAAARAKTQAAEVLEKLPDELFCPITSRPRGEPSLGARRHAPLSCRPSNCVRRDLLSVACQNCTGQ